MLSTRARITFFGTDRSRRRRFKTFAVRFRTAELTEECDGNKRASQDSVPVFCLLPRRPVKNGNSVCRNVRLYLIELALYRSVKGEKCVRI